MIAESFDPEVILAAEWLAKFRIPIAAFSDFRRRVQGDTLISIDQTFPLPGVDDLYVLRSARAVEGEDGRSWEDVLKDVSLPFVRRRRRRLRRRI
ncbi:MAG TPA: hypothetical protein VFA43_11835 [Gemmatimonadaceae bacterium]|nr:hypothetical protein [Gemmatimonadaceae bacterium]